MIARSFAAYGSCTHCGVESIDRGWLVPLCANYGTTRTFDRPQRITLLPSAGVAGNCPQVISRPFMRAKVLDVLTNFPTSGDGFTVDLGLVCGQVGVSVLFARHRTGGVIRTDAINPPSLVAVRKTHE